MEINVILQNKTILVTGATNGIGEITALELARLGATVIVAGRSRERVDATVDRIRRETNNLNTAGLIADLSLMSEVRKLAAEFRSKYNRLDVLVNNAGAVFSTRQVTAEGIEMTFALNHLSYFLLTHELLDLLKSSAPSRVVNVSSDAHQVGMRFDDIQFERGYNGFGPYGQSKMCNVLFTYELARRLEGTGVTVNALHPGFVRTGFGKGDKSIPGRILSTVFGILQQFGAITPEEGAKTSIYLASSPEVEGGSGKYFVKSQPKESHPSSYNQDDQRKLWDISAKLTGVQP
jgi:NAD(P)-dependent dehydrogenase (short-subunit alcohol dehydrogenase family)